MLLLRRALPAVLLLAVALAAYVSGVLNLISLDGFARHRAELREAAAATPLLAVGAYIAIFAVLTAACLPVALILTLASGAVFGTWIGGAATAVAATTAATGTYLAARSALASLLLRQVRGDPRFERLRSGLMANSFSVILTSRLIPMFPFALVNIAAGVAAAPLRAYVPATLVGAIPTSFLYASLGAGLGAALADESSLRAAAGSGAVLWPLVGLAILSFIPTLVRRWRRSRP